MGKLVSLQSTYLTFARGSRRSQIRWLIIFHHRTTILPLAKTTHSTHIVMFDVIAAKKIVDFLNQLIFNVQITCVEL